MTTAPSRSETEPTIRPATAEDVEAVHRIERASFPQPWPYGSFETYLLEGGFFVAEGTDRRIRGYVIADAIPNNGTPIGHVKDIAVAADHRDRGIGSALLSHGLDHLASEGAATAKLEVREGNRGAMRLYRRFGFERRRRIRGYYGNGEDACVMVRHLEDWPADRQA